MSSAPVPPACFICVDSKAEHYCRKESADYYICRRCGLIFQHPLPTRNSMIEWADDAYASGAYRDYVEARPMKIRHFQDRLAELGRDISPGDCLMSAAPADTSWKSRRRTVLMSTVWNSHPARLPLPVLRSGLAFSKAYWRPCPTAGPSMSSARLI